MAKAGMLAHDCKAFDRSAYYRRQTERWYDQNLATVKDPKDPPPTIFCSILFLGVRLDQAVCSI